MSVKVPDIFDGKKVLQIIRDEFNQAGEIISALAQANTHGDKYRPGIRASVKTNKKIKKSKKGKFKLYGGKNPTDKLYSQTGALLRAMQIGQPANIFKVKSTPSEVQILYGIDISKVPYARIHEFGGIAGRGAKIRKRPYIFPAIKEFFNTEIDRTIKNIYKRLSE